MVWPTAKHVVVLTQLTPLSCFVMPEVCADHVVPPFVVATMAPVAPTAQHVAASTHDTDSRFCVVFEFCVDQVVPPLVVLRM